MTDESVRNAGARRGRVPGSAVKSVGDDADYMGFIGVTTGSSSIMRVFPLWADALRLPTQRLVGHDVALNAAPGEYRRLIDRIHHDPRHRGALITTHKMAVYAAAADMFDELDDLALRFGEVSSVAKRAERLTGAAKDPVTVVSALDELVPSDHFRGTGAAALVIGAGGSGNALSYQLATREDSPSRIVVVSTDNASLRHARDLHALGGAPDGLVDYARTSDPEDVDRLVESLPPGSLVVNASGMGKDRPGSPVTRAAVFPEHGIAWDFNYRGSLEFLRQAEAQKTTRGLRTEDGWRYFIHGWTQVIADVFEIPMPPERVDALSAIARRAVDR
jgi:shikimate 5-dehydrogenase